MPFSYRQKGRLHSIEGKEEFAFLRFKKLEVFYEKKWRKRKHLTNIQDFKNKLPKAKGNVIKLL